MEVYEKITESVSIFDVLHANEVNKYRKKEKR